MSTVSEQIQRYRAIKAQETPERDMGDTAVLERVHPSKKDYFQDLMQRWHSDYMKRLMPKQPAPRKDSL